MSHAMWLKTLFDPEDLTSVCNNIANEINHDKLLMSIDAIAITGISGAVLGGAISFLTGIPLIVIRKDDKTHSGYDVEYSDELNRLNTLHYIIIDDLIATGATIQKIQEKINKRIGVNELVKIYLYHDSASKASFTMENLDINCPIFAIGDQE